MDVSIARVVAFLLMLGTFAIVLRLGCAGMEAERAERGAADGSAVGGSAAGGAQGGAAYPAGAADPWSRPAGVDAFGRPNDPLGGPAGAQDQERWIQRLRSELESSGDPMQVLRSKLDDGTLRRLENSPLVEQAEQWMSDPKTRRRAEDALRRALEEAASPRSPR